MPGVICTYHRFAIQTELDIEHRAHARPIITGKDLLPSVPKNNLLPMYTSNKT